MSGKEEDEEYIRYKDKIDGYRAEFDDLKNLDINEVQRISKMIDLSDKTLEKENYKRLDTMFPNLEELLKVAKQKAAIVKLTKALESVSGAITVLEENDIDTKEFRKLLGEANQNLESKAYGEAKNGALKIRDMLKNLPDKNVRELALKALNEGAKNEDAKPRRRKPAPPPGEEDAAMEDGPGEDYTEESGSDDGGEAPAGEEIKDEEPPPPPPAEEMPDINDEIKLTWSRIKDAKAQDLDMDAAIEALDKARDSFKDSDHDNAVKYLKESNELIQNAQKSEKFTDLKEKLNEVQDLVEKIEKASKDYEQVVNTRDIRDLLTNAQLLMDSGSSEEAKETIEKANWHSNQMMNTIMKNEEKKAISALKETKIFLKSLKERGVDISKAKEIFKEAEPALATGDFHKVVKKAKESMDAARMAEAGQSEVTAQELVNYINDMVTELNSLRVDFEKLEGQITEFLDLFEKKDYDAVLEKGEDLKNQLYFLKMERLKEEAQDSITEISNLLLELRDQQATGLQSAEAAFSAAQDSFNLKEYEKSLEHSEESLKELHAHLKVIIGAKLADLKENLDYIDKLDVRDEDKERIKAYHDNAQKLLDAEEVMKAKADIVSGKSKVNEVLKSFCTEKMVSIQMAMSDIQSRTGGEDAGVAEVETMFVEFGKTFKSEDYIGALKTSHEVEMKLNLYLSNYVAESIKDVEVHIPKLKDHNINVLEVTEALLDVKSYVSEQKYVEAYQRISKVKEDLENASKDKATGLVVMVQEEIGKLKDRGTDTKKIEARFRELGQKFGEKDYLTVIEISQEIQKMIEDEEKYQKVVEDLLQSKHKIQEADAMGVDISEAAALLQTARPLLEDSKFDEALEVSLKCREFTQGLIERTQGINEELKTKVDEKLVQIEQKFSEMRNTGIDVTTAEGIYEQTKKALEMGDHNQAFNLANECLDELEKESRLYTELSQAISQAKTKINDGKSNGLDVSQAEALFQQMGPALDSKDYETIKELSRQIVEEIVKQEEGAKRQQTNAGDSKKVVLEEVGRAQAAIDDLKNQGIEPKKAVELFQQIVPEMQAGNLEKAIELARQSRDSADSLLKLYQDFQGRLNEVAALITETKEMGIILSEADQIFDAIQKSIGEGDMINARELADKCVKEVELTQAEMEKAATQLTEIEAQLNDAMAYGLNPTKAPGLLQQAREAYQRGDYKKSIQATNECAMDIMSVIPE